MGPATKVPISVHVKQLRQENANLYVLDEHLMQDGGRGEKHEKVSVKRDMLQAGSAFLS